MIEKVNNSPENNTYEPDEEEIKPELLIRYNSFEEARKVSRGGLSDYFIDEAITQRFTESYIKSYLDSVDITPKDQEIIDNPELIAQCYSDTTEMLIRNLMISITIDDNPETYEEKKRRVKKAKELFISHLKDQVPTACDEMIDWCEGRTHKFPVDQVGYTGLDINGADILDSTNNKFPDIRPNFKIQRQQNGVFIMAYSNPRVNTKMTEDIKKYKAADLDNRIYLNPDINVTPIIFEQILRQANEHNISLQLKMFQRAPELASIHRKQTDGDYSPKLRGDGIVVWTNHEDTNNVLQLILSLAKENSQAFKGRKTSRIPQNIAEGIAVGDEPRVSNHSLTSHRAALLSHIALKTQESGKQGPEARTMFRQEFQDICTWNNINPNNIAFNNN